MLFSSISAWSAKFIMWTCRFISAISSNLPLALLHFIKSHNCLQLYGLDGQPESIQNVFLRRETSLTGLKCEGGFKGFPLVVSYWISFFTRNFTSLSLSLASYITWMSAHWAALSRVGYNPSSVLVKICGHFIVVFTPTSSCACSCDCLLSKLSLHLNEIGLIG